MWEDLNIFALPNHPVPFFGELVGQSNCDRTYFQSRRESDVTVLEYVVSGCGTVKVNGNNYTVKAGDVYLLPLFSNHTYHSCSDEPWIKYFINVRGDLPSILIRAYQLELSYVFHAPQTQELFFKLYDIAKQPLDEAFRQEQFTLCFHNILIRLRNCINMPQEGNEAALIKSLIDNTPNKLYSIEDLASRFNRSKDFIIKIFQKQYHITPHAYIIQDKIEIAKQLLLNTSLHIEDIAYSIGYQNPEYFSNLFKHRCGVSPRNFRNQRNRPESTNTK